MSLIIMQDTQQVSSGPIQGVVERVTFHNPENGFCVLRVKAQGHLEPITVVGNALSIAAGEHIECEGEWHHDSVYGQQYKANRYLKSLRPNTLEAIQAYLGSGLVKGVGMSTANILIQAFGEDVLTVIENEPHRLLALPGIGEAYKKQIIESVAEQKSLRDVMMFLQSHHISTAKAVRIYQTYGDDAIAAVTDNPYQLAHDIQGMSFKASDELALRLGLPLNSIERARAGIHHVLDEYCLGGHCAADYQYLVDESMALLRMTESVIKEAIQEEIAAERLILNKIDNKPCLFPTHLYNAELESAMHLHRLSKGKRPWGQMDVTQFIPWMEEKTGLELAKSQKRAIKTVLKHKLAIMTGGPGVGKTTIVYALVKIMQAKYLSIALCAPTGRAAKRLAEATGLKAKTIHRLLGLNPETHTFKHDETHPLPIDVLIVDEASMIDTVLLNHLLKAIPTQAAVLFVGDVDQLPSVGSGAILLDMIRSNIIPTVRLSEIFRQAAHSNIIVNAHRINQGELPLPNTAKESDFYTLYANTPEDIHTLVLDLVCQRLPNYTQCDPMKEIQVLTPMNRGALGTVALNAALQKQLNGQAEPKVVRGGFTFAPGDKVIQTVNNYEKDIFNGDMGCISHINLEANTVKVVFDHRMIEYAFAELDELSLAYAISVHKSQGSEFPVVVMVVSTQHYRLLARNLLYTGVTRGKRLVVVVGEKRAMSLAVKNNREHKRLTKLVEHLRA